MEVHQLCMYWGGGEEAAVHELVCLHTLLFCAELYNARSMVIIGREGK